MRNKKNVFVIMIIFILLGIFGYAAGKLYGFYKEYQNGNQEYEEMRKYIEDSDDGKEKKSSEEQVEKTSEDKFLKIDFDGLRQQNPDIKAWIQIPALDISYPVVQGEDNCYYLHHLSDGQKNKNGSIFIDCHNGSDFTDQNTIIYGHNMKNGSMFGKLDRYKDKTLFEAYPSFYIYLPGKVLEYRIVSCYAGRTGSVAYTYQFSEVKDFQNFITKIISQSDYDTGIEVAEGDRIVTLSTCMNTDLNYRYLIHGKLNMQMEN